MYVTVEKADVYLKTQNCTNTLLLHVLLFLLFCMTLAPMVIASSNAMTAIPKQTRTFVCTFIGHTIPYWVVSGGDSPVTVRQGETVSFFTMPTISEIIEGGTVARLEVSVDLSLNGTTYVCHIDIVGGTTVASDPAKLTVFGRYCTEQQLQARMHEPLCETLYLVCTPFVYKTTSSAICRHSRTHTATHPPTQLNTHQHLHTQMHSTHTATHLPTQLNTHQYLHTHTQMCKRTRHTLTCTINTCMQEYKSESSLHSLSLSLLSLLMQAHPWHHMPLILEYATNLSVWDGKNHGVVI